jgi:hypothetical protein
MSGGMGTATLIGSLETWWVEPTRILSSHTMKEDGRREGQRRKRKERKEDNKRKCQHGRKKGMVLNVE